MIAERPARAALTVSAAISRAGACWWWLLRAHVVDRHLLPRDLALGPPPARWLKDWPRG